MNAPNWEVRRTAAYLLREFGGTEGLKELVPLLADTEPLVQREAVQALMLNGTDEASRILLQAITSASGRSRETLLNELTGTATNARRRCSVTSCATWIAARSSSSTPRRSVALGTFGGPDAVEALKFALHQGDFWSPLATRRHAIGRRAGPAPDWHAGRHSTVLREASSRGPRGVRAAARTELSRST